MFGNLYEWLKDVSFYLILVTAVLYVLPSNSYRKYIRFFTGLVLIILLLNPVLSLFGMEKYTRGDFFEEFEDGYKGEADEWMRDTGSDRKIEVEEIVIGP